MKALFQIILVLVLLTAAIPAQETQQSVFNKLKEKYEGLQDISFNFSCKEQADFKGSLTAKPGNKFHLKLKSNDFICNGKTIWNFVPSKKKVMLTNFDENELPTTLDNIFFYFSKKFKPVALTKEQKSSAKSKYVLTLAPIEPDKVKFKSIKLWLDKSSMNITTVQIMSNEEKMTFNVSKIQLNKKIKDSQFEFNTPKGVESIDLR